MQLSLLRVNWRLLTEMDGAGKKLKCGCGGHTCKEGIFFIEKMDRLLKN